MPPLGDQFLQASLEALEALEETALYALIPKQLLEK